MRAMGFSGKVLIIGGGIGGLTLAHALASREIEYEVFEQAPQLLPLGAGLLLHPGAMSAFGELGLAAAIAQAGQELVRGAAQTRDGDRLQETALDELRTKVGAGTYGIHRARLHEVLGNGVDAKRLGRVFVRCEATSEGVSAYFADGSVARGTLLVGCDGLRSRVRGELFGDERLRYAGYTSWRGVASGDAFFPPSELREIWGRGERFGVVPIGHGETYWFAVADAPEGERDEDSRSEVQRRFAPWSEAIARLLEATPAERVLRTDIYDRKPRTRWSRDRVTLLGDAAHPMTPNLGQGACMAVEDAWVLARSLATKPDLASALADYEACRVPRTTHMVNSSRNLGRMAQLRNGALIWMRNAMLRATPPHVVEKQLLENARFEP